MKIFKLIYKNFLPYAISLFLIFCIAIVSLFLLYQNHNNNYINIIQNSVNDQLERILKRDTNILLRSVVLLQQNRTLVENFKDLDVNKLYKNSKPILEGLEKDFNINYMYFYTDNQSNFLSVHNNNKKNIDVRRYTLVKSMEQNIVVSGLEYDKTDGLAIRVVAPIFFNKYAIGYVELSKSLNITFDTLAKNIQNDIIVKLNSELKKPPSIIYNSNKSLYKDLSEETIENKKILQDAIFTSNRILDVAQIDIGSLIIAFDQRENNLNLYWLAGKISLLMIFISIFILSIHYKYIKKTNLQIRKNQKDIVRLTITDDLTKLYNRRHFNKVLPVEFSKAKRDKKYIAFFLVIIDNFRLYNEEFGHAEGDLLLKRVSKKIKIEMKRPTDLVFRINGEKFAIFTTDIKQINIEILATKLLQTIESEQIEHPLNYNHKIVTLSIGVHSQLINEELDLDHVYKEAEIALLAAKDAGRNNYKASFNIL